jgi:protein TonB
MPTYTAAEPRDRWKAITAALIVNGALALIIVSGLHMRIVDAAVDRLKTFNLPEPPPPPPPLPPPPRAKPQPQMKKPQGAPAKKAQPSPIVAPPTPLPVRSPLPAAKVAGTGSASTSGAGTSGSGTGAGGSGKGTGGGGTADYARFTPARRISQIPDKEYSRLAATGAPYGSVGIIVRVNTDGSASNCRVVRSSGYSAGDLLTCYLTERYVRFTPALDRYGRPIAQDVTWTSYWEPRT